MYFFKRGFIHKLYKIFQIKIWRLLTYKMFGFCLILYNERFVKIIVFNKMKTQLST